MNLFVYSWEVLCENPIKIRGHALDTKNVYKYVDIDNYESFCYCRNGTTGYHTSDDIYSTELFTKKYSRYKDELKGCMGEINVIPVFTATTGLGYTGWIYGELQVHPRPLIMCFDIEVVSSTSGMPQPYVKDDRIEMVSCVFRRYLDDNDRIFLLHLDDYELCIDDVTSISCNDELDMIHKFFDLIKTINPDVITGFNIYGFDFDYIVSKLQYYMEYTTMCSRPNLEQFVVEDMDWNSSAYGYNRYKKIKIGGRVIFDMMLYFKRFKLEKYSLDVISNKFLNEGKDDMPYKEMFENFRNRTNLEKVASYCIKDSLLVLKLFDKFNVWNELCETSRIMRCHIEDIYTRGEQLKVTNQMIKECIDRDIVLVKRDVEDQRDYGGATVLDPTKGIHKNCVVLDFQSLYPSIIIAFNICPSTVKSNFSKKEMGLFPGCIKNLLEERKNVKARMINASDSIEKIILDKKQNALKICANSMYGTMGFASNVYFGSITCAEKVTSLGRQILESTVDQINEYVDVIYGDTDSCMLKFPDGMSSKKVTEYAKLISQKVSSTLPNPIVLKFEEYYKKMILFSKKRYIMIREDNTLKYKGVMIARRGYCDYAKNLFSGVISMISSDKSQEEIRMYIDESIVNMKAIPIDKFKMTKSVKDVNDYKSEVPQVIMAKRLIEQGDHISAGTRLEYVFVKLDVENRQGDKMYTIEEVKQYGLMIDYRYYIEKQVVNPVDELLNLIGLENYIKNWYF